MHAESFKSINELLVNMSRILLNEGQPRVTRGNKCYELPEPIMIKLENPTARLITLPEREWPVHMGYAESLWIASGRNDVEFMSIYLPRMKEFSDDGRYVRGGYGPRIRAYNNSTEDYKINNNNSYNSFSKKIDQLEYVVDCLRDESTSRRAVIELGDPIKDNYFGDSLKKTKDYPCTRSLQFIINNNQLDMYVHMRSNDFVWGMTGVNIFNFTFIQEYISQMLGVKLGSYYHIANNLHFYEAHKDKLKRISKSCYENDSFIYKREITNYGDFKLRLNMLSDWEENIRNYKDSGLIDLGSDFMNDWQKIIYQYLTGKRVSYVNPILNRMR
ncbi:thymidylate synthase [Photobacterium damselae]|uniref:thymidylate synthase n=1 Tax=Photobacterium damselae TaxID=38293 RepID=UPI003C6E2401